MRKRLFQGLGGLSAVGLAGCLGEQADAASGDDNETGNGNETATGDTNETANGDTENGNETGNGEEPNGNGPATGDDADGGAENGDDAGGGDTGERQWNRDHEFEADPEAATDWSNYDITELDVHNNMMSMAIRPDGMVFYITRGALFGEDDTGTAVVNYVSPDGEDSGTALELPVSTFEEDGGQGIAFDPDFEENGWVYIFYVPREDDLETPDDPYYLISRFEMDGDEIDRESEQEVIRVHHQRQTCCHVGHYLEFGPEGDLYISTGDDTNPFNSSGYAPLDEREGEFPEDHEEYAGLQYKYFDAQRTSGNTADLRGSVLRITPEDDGGYSVPDGNLKQAYEHYLGTSFSEEEFRPEIYVMGCRNPYTLAVDDYTGSLHIADYGPDAGSWDTDRGPQGLVEYRRVCGPQNAGWPFSRGFNYPYRRYDFETEEEGQPFWPENLTNDSRNNTGLRELPPVEPATLWYGRNWEDLANNSPPWVDMPRPGEVTWPELPNGGAPMTGPAYRYAEEYGEGALDPYFDGKQFIMEWGVNYIKYLTYNDDGTIEINDFLPADEVEIPRSEVNGGDDENGEDGNGEDDGDEEQVGAEPGTQFEFDGETGGWVGIAPDVIADEQNPTLRLQEGETYEIGWTEGDGANHNIAIWNEEDEVVDDLATETTTDQNPESQWLEFEASEEMTTYICEVHPTTMVGDIEVVSGDGGNGEEAENGEDEEETENGEEPAEFLSPNDMAVGPDGRLFLQTYGSGFDGENGRIYKIEYTG